MHLDPKCPSRKHDCEYVCTSIVCRVKNPFVCKSCNNYHEQSYCQKIPYKKLVKQFHKIQGLYTNEVLKFEEKVENTFTNLMKSLKAEFLKFREAFEMTNINESISNVYDKIKDGRENQLTAEIIHFAMKSRKKSNELKIRGQLQMKMIRSQILDLYGQVVKKLPQFYSLNNHLEQVQKEQDILEGNIVKKIQNEFKIKRRKLDGLLQEYFPYVQQIMKKEVDGVRLLYKASDHNFSAKKFHELCDGVENTLTIARTQYNKIVIGFCPFRWESPKKWVYKQDTKDQCFLISPQKSLKGKLFTVTKTKFAIGMHEDYGPAFGDDFVIYDKAENSNGCWSNFPDVYICKNKQVPHTDITIKNFIGVNDHYQKFNLLEWQVYKISNSRLPDVDNSMMKQYRMIDKM